MKNINYENYFIEVPLPKPLSKNETNELFHEMHQGNQEAKQKLIEHNIKLVFKSVRSRFKTVDYDKNDIVSIGIMGLIKAIDTFDLSKNSAFSSYAITCINNEILMFLRKLKKYENIDSLDKTINHDKDGNELKIEDIIPDDYNSIEKYFKDLENKENEEIIKIIIEKLSEKEQKIIKMRYGFYNNKIYTQQEIANSLNISRSYMSRLEKKIIKKLAVLFEKTEKEGIKPNKKEGKNMAKKLQTIYEYFNNYTKEEIDTTISKLTEEEKELIRLRYGNDLNNPTTSKEWNKEKNSKFYYNLIPLMKKMLADPNYIRNKRGRKPKKQENIEQPTFIKHVENKNTENELEAANKIIPTSIKNEETNPIILNDEINNENIKALEMFNNSNFIQMIKYYSPKEIMIISLKLGFVNGKYYQASEIATFLGIDAEEVINITKNLLLNYKEQVNKIIDNAILNATEENSNSKIKTP